MNLVLFVDLQLIKTSVQFNEKLQKLFSSGFFKLKTHYKCWKRYLPEGPKMAKQFTALDSNLRDFILRQNIFFTASATEDSRVNISPPCWCRTESPGTRTRTSTRPPSARSSTTTRGRWRTLGMTTPWWIFPWLGPSRGARQGTGGRGSRPSARSVSGTRCWSPRTGCGPRSSDGISRASNKKRSRRAPHHLILDPSHRLKIVLDDDKRPCWTHT